MLSKKYNYDNYIEFDTEYRDLFSKFAENGLINIYDVLTIRKQLPEELLVQLKRKHIQSEFSFKNIVQDDEVKYIKPKTKEEIEQERRREHEELKKIEREKREALIELARQQEITKTIRDNIIKADEIKRITNEFDSWLKTVCELVHLSKILNYEEDDLIEIQKDITNDLKTIDPKTKIQSNMFGFKGKTYEDLLIMLSDKFKKEREEVKEEKEEVKEEQVDLNEEQDFEEESENYDYDYSDDEESNGDDYSDDDYIHGYDDELEMHSAKYDRTKIWDSKRRKDNKVKSNKRFVNFRDKKKQDGLKGGNLEHRKKIFYYLVSLFDEVYDSHIEQNKQRIENILICESYICMYNDDSFGDIVLSNFKSNSVFDNVIDNIVSIYHNKDSLKKEIYDKLFKNELHSYNLLYINQDNLLSSDCVKFMKEFDDKIKKYKDELLKYKENLIIDNIVFEDAIKWNDQIDINVKMYESYKDILTKDFIEKINKYNINFYTDGLYDLIKGNLANMNRYKVVDQSYNLKDNRFNFEKLISKLEVSYKYNFDVTDFYNKFTEIIDKTYNFKQNDSKTIFYEDWFIKFIKLYDTTKYEVIKEVIRYYTDPKVFGDCDLDFLIDKLKVRYKYNFNVSEFFDRFIALFNKTYDFERIGSKIGFYKKIFTKLIETYESTKYEVIKEVIQHYTKPKLFNVCDLDFLIDKLKVSYKYNFNVSGYYDKFIKTIDETYDLEVIESCFSFYNDCFTKLIETYDSTNYEVIEKVIQHYANPEVFDAYIDEYSRKIIETLYNDFKKTTEGYKLIKDYLKERINYFIKNTNFATYDKIFDVYIKNYNEFAAAYYNKIVDKLEKDHNKEDKDLKTYFETKIEQYKDKRYSEIGIIKEKLTSIIKELIPQCEIYVIVYYNDDQLTVFKDDIENRVKELITNYYNGLSVDDFIIKNPKDEDSSTMIITAFKDKDYSLDNLKEKAWKEFEEHYRDCVVNKLKEIADKLSFDHITYILFVLKHIQTVDDLWITQIIGNETETINQKITKHLRDNLNSVKDCIDYLTTTIDVNTEPVLKYFFCIDKIAEIIKNICELDVNFDFVQYENIIKNNYIQDNVKNTIRDKFKDKLVELFEKENISLDNRIEQYERLKKEYEVPLRTVLYNKFKTVIGIDDFARYIEHVGFNNFNVDKYTTGNSRIIKELKEKYKVLENEFDNYFNGEKYKKYITKEIYETKKHDNVFIIDELYYNYYLSFYQNNISNENLFDIIDYYNSEHRKDDHRKEHTKPKLIDSYKTLLDHNREQNLTIEEIKKVIDYDNDVLFDDDGLIQQFSLKIQKTIGNLIDNISSEKLNLIDELMAFYEEIEKIEKDETLNRKMILLNPDSIKTYLINRLLNKFNPSINISCKLLVEKYNQYKLSNYNQDFKVKFISIIENQIKDKKYEEIIEDYNDVVYMDFKESFKTRIVNSMLEEIDHEKRVLTEESEEEIRLNQERRIELIKKYIKLYDAAKYIDFKQNILEIIDLVFQQLYIKSENWNWINTYLYINHVFNLTEEKEIIKQITLSLNEHFLTNLSLQDFAILYYISLRKEQLKNINDKFKVVEKYEKFFDSQLYKLNELLLNFDLTPREYTDKSSELKYILNKEMILKDSSELIIDNEKEDVNLIVYLYESMKERKVNNDFVHLLEELLCSKIKKEVFEEKNVSVNRSLEIEKDSIDYKFEKIKEHYNLKEKIQYEFLNLISNTFNVSILENKRERLKFQTYKSIAKIIDDVVNKLNIVVHW